jgi:hypothetical protein
MQRDVVDARQRVVMGSHAALHAVLGWALFEHFFFLDQRVNRWAL